MKETILSIEEEEGFRKYNPKYKDSFNTYDGFRVITSCQEILLLIDNEQHCCEDWGYLWCNGSAEEFIGAEVLQVNLVDKALRKEALPDMYEGEMMFVNIETDRGTLQFVAYNIHNGYYGHNAIVECKQLTEIKVL